MTFFIAFFAPIIALWKFETIINSGFHVVQIRNSVYESPRTNVNAAAAIVADLILAIKPNDSFISHG